MNRPLVIYHTHCVDGFTAAWVAHRHFVEKRGIEPELLPAQYGDEPPDENTVAGRDIVIVDFSYPLDVLLWMQHRAASIRVLDHHRTAQNEIGGLSFAVFDMGRSGAGLAWDELMGGPRPWLVDYVEDRDLWRWELPRSREVSAGLATYDFDLAVWDDFVDSLHLGGRLFEVADEGEAILRYQARVVRKHVESARVMMLAGHEVPVVNATTLHSEIGNDLSKTAPFAAMWSETSTGRIAYALRSSAENPAHVDVSAIARTFGGGGHRHAAGFVVDAFVHGPVCAARV